MSAVRRSVEPTRRRAAPFVSAGLCRRRARPVSSAYGGDQRSTRFGPSVIGTINVPYTERSYTVELLGALLVIAAIIWMVVKLIRSSSGWDSKTVYQQQLAASQAWIDECERTYQQMEMICAPVPLGLDSDEQVVFALPGVHLLEARAIRRSRNSYGGPTIRLAKGLSLRLGAGVSQSESQDELRSIDDGTLVLTTKRLAFLGSLRTNNVRLDDIIGIRDYIDGIQVHRERKDRAETYILSQPIRIPGGSGRGLTVFGPMIMAAIQLAKAYDETPEAVAVVRQQTGTPKRQYPYVEYQPGMSPLQYGSLHHSSTDLQPTP